MTILNQRKIRSGKPDEQKKPRGRFAATDLGYVKLNPRKITIPRKLEEGFDQDVACRLAESIEADDLINAPLVRKVQDRWVCVAGQHRIQACILSGKEKIVCKVFRGDDVEAERIQLAEDLNRKHLTALEKANKLTRYMQLSSSKFTFSGQVVQKSGPGRPEGGLSSAARRMPVKGRSVQARRKELSKAAKIASIVPEAQRAAVEAKLSNNQSALLKISKAGPGAMAQLAAVRRLSAEQSATKPGGKESKTPRNHKKPRDQTNGGGDETKDTQQPAETETPKETQLSELEAVWNAHLKALWRWASKDTRSSLIGQISRARLYAKPDIDEFIDRVFSGRIEVKLRVAKEFASRSGVDWKQLKSWLNHLGFKNRKRKTNGTRFFKVPEEFSGRLKIMTDAELKAVDDEVHERTLRNALLPKRDDEKRAPDNYYDL